MKEITVDHNEAFLLNICKCKEPYSSHIINTESIEWNEGFVSVTFKCHDTEIFKIMGCCDLNENMKDKMKNEDFTIEELKSLHNLALNSISKEPQNTRDWKFLYSLTGKLKTKIRHCLVGDQDVTNHINFEVKEEYKDMTTKEYVDQFIGNDIDKLKAILSEKTLEYLSLENNNNKQASVLEHEINMTIKSLEMLQCDKLIKQKAKNELL